MSTMSAEAAIAAGNKELQQRENEIFVRDGETVVLTLARTEDGRQYKNVTVVNRKGYQLYGVPCIEGDREKLFFVFPTDAPRFYDVAKGNSDRVTVKRDKNINQYS